MSDEKITLEQRFDQLETIISHMEETGVSLDESFELYKKGLEEVKACNTMLDEIEKAMLIMNEEGELEEF